MSTQDAKQLANFFTNKIDLLDKNTYSEVSYIQLPDQNQGSYTSNQISYNTITLAQNFIVLSDSILFIPFQIKSSTATPFTANSEVAFKQSFLQLISGITITTASGTSIVNSPGDSSLSIINSIKPLIELSEIDIKQVGPEFSFYGVDRTVPVSTAGGSGLWTSTQNSTLFTGVTATGTNSTASTAIENPALKNRVQLLRQYNSSGIWSCAAYLPLARLHEFFARLNFPIVNFPLLITFYINTGSSFQPLVVTGNSDVQQKPVIIIGHSNPVDGFISNSSRLFCKSVKFKPQASQAIAKALSSGISKTIEYQVTNLFTFSNLSTTNNSINQLITSSLVRPTRIWIFAVPAGGLNSFQTLSPGVTQAGIRWYNVNLSVNNTNYYSNNINTPFELYKLLQDECIHSDHYDFEPGRPQGLISFNDWLQSYQLLCFNLHRLRLMDPNSACNILFTANYDSSRVPSGTTSFDLVVCVERLQTLEMRLSSNDVNLIISNGQK